MKQQAADKETADICLQEQLRAVNGRVRQNSFPKMMMIGVIMLIMVMLMSSVMSSAVMRMVMKKQLATVCKNS